MRRVASTLALISIVLVASSTASEIRYSSVGETDGVDCHLSKCASANQRHDFHERRDAGEALDAVSQPSEPSERAHANTHESNVHNTSPTFQPLSMSATEWATTITKFVAPQYTGMKETDRSGLIEIDLVFMSPGSVRPVTLETSALRNNSHRSTPESHATMAALTAGGIYNTSWPPISAFIPKGPLNTTAGATRVETQWGPSNHEPLHSHPTSIIFSGTARVPTWPITALIALSTLVLCAALKAYD